MRQVQLALSCVHWDDLLETVNPQVPQGDPSALLPLPGLRAEPRTGNDHEGAVRDGGRPDLMMGCWGLSL